MGPSWALVGSTGRSPWPQPPEHRPQRLQHRPQHRPQSPEDGPQPPQHRPHSPATAPGAQAAAPRAQAAAQAAVSGTRAAAPAAAPGALAAAGAAHPFPQLLPPKPVFRCTAKVRTLKNVPGCACHMARWIRDAAAAHDARGLAPPPLPTTGSATDAVNDMAIEGLGKLCQHARLPRAASRALEQVLLQMGAVNVQELVMSEWADLQACALLKPFEQRRLLSCLQ